MNILRRNHPESFAGGSERRMPVSLKYIGRPCSSMTRQFTVGHSFDDSIHLMRKMTGSLVHELSENSFIRNSFSTRRTCSTK